MLYFYDQYPFFIKTEALFDFTVLKEKGSPAADGLLGQRVNQQRFPACHSRLLCVFAGFAFVQIKIHIDRPDQQAAAPEGFRINPQIAAQRNGHLYAVKQKGGGVRSFPVVSVRDVIVFPVLADPAVIMNHAAAFNQRVGGIDVWPILCVGGQRDTQ